MNVFVGDLEEAGLASCSLTADAELALSSLPSGGAVYCGACTQPEAGVAPPSVVPSQVKYSASLGHSLRKMQVTDSQGSQSEGGPAAPQCSSLL